jgi:ABC-type glutathione transport system ATPase component
MSDHGTERAHSTTHDEPEPMRDPVCGMDLTLEHLSTATRRGVRYSFCGPGCASRFHHEPDRFFGEPLVKVRGLRRSFSFGDVVTHVLQGIDLNIWPGDFIAIVGASGSGKSTLLNMLGLLDRPTEGSIHIKHRDADSMSDDERALLSFRAVNSSGSRFCARSRTTPRC